MKQKRIKEILSKINEVRIAVYGDFCLDAYWILDPRGAGVSVETGLNVEAVSRQIYSPGGAGNVVANVAALQPESLHVIGVVGNDIYGKELTSQLKSIGANTNGLVIQEDNFDTYTYLKKYYGDKEEPRIDFGFFNKRSEETDAVILENIRFSLEHYEALIFNQQIPGSIANDSFIDEVNKLFEEFSDKIILIDTRDYSDKLFNVYRKSNEIELAVLYGIDAKPTDFISFTDIKKYGKSLWNKYEKPIITTCGARGVICFDESGILEIPGIQLTSKLDTVGAGDTFTSALTCCLAAGFSSAEAAEFANFASAVTVQKLRTTGTASGDEILQISNDADYNYSPELAEDLRMANYVSDTEIEICDQQILFDTGNIKHVVFDHDGTISTQREGWEKIMEPVMIKAILGDRYATADKSLLDEVRKQSLEFIDKTTGIQTNVQMDGLVKMIEEMGYVPKDEILDKFGYKKIYNNALMEMVNKRIAKLESGELSVNDFTMKGAVDLIKALKEKGIKIYLASGTDEEDVINEAESLGYADFFDGGIYGSVGDISKYSKKMVIERIISENKLKGSELMVVGDGPVEIKECRKVGGIAVGIASDEVRRYGLNETKRTRLIKAGAQIIIPDFSQWKNLMNLLFL
jgi:rfaE bifunctional protein kinase chain/domain